jgi:para-aminobenzoate synthetase
VASGGWTRPRPALTPASPDQQPAEPATDPADIERWLDRDRARYLADIADCQRQLPAGESYEICLTNTLRMPAGPDPLAAYRELRRHNPAPYGAFLRLGDLAVLSSSPERFLRVHRGRAGPRAGRSRAPHPGTPTRSWTGWPPTSWRPTRRRGPRT